jgi:hypothetical protein
MRCLVCAAILLATSAFRPATPPAERNAVLISWDGAGGEHVRDSLAKGALPNLAALVRQGALVDLEVTGHGTDTKSGHAQMLTGYDASVTGVYSNAKFGPIPRGHTIFERLRQSFGKRLVTIMVTSKGPNLGSLDPGAGLAEPFHLTRRELTVWEGDRIRTARSVGERAVRHVARYANRGRFLAFVHFADVDGAGHYHGEDSSEYDKALADCDLWLGKIMAELKAQKASERTLVYVTADHGFDKGTKRHASATRVFLATNDPSVSLPGEQRDIAPTLLSAMGVDLTKINPPLPGKVLAK